MAMFKPATRKKLKLRMALCGPAKSGKSFTGLMSAFVLAKADGGRVFAIDSERKSLRKYAEDTHHGVVWNFDVCELESFDPATYTTVIAEAARSRPAVLLIDGLSQAWDGVKGALDQIDQSSSTNKFAAWKNVTPKHRRMIDAILAFPGHVIVTMRTKMEYVLEEQTNAQGRVVQVPRKVGLAPIQRAGMEYEFDIVGEMDPEHTLTISGSRCSAVDGLRVEKPGPDFMEPILRWLDSGVVEAPGAGSGKDEAEETKETPPSATVADRWNKTLATPGQVAEIKSLALQVYGTKEKVIAAIHWALAKRRKPNLAELTDLEADELILKLKEKLDTSKPRESF